MTRSSRSKPDDRARPSRARLGNLLALAGLTGFAISQPILSVAGENPGMFAFYDVTGRSMVVFALVVALVPPLVLWLVLLAVAQIRPRAADVLFLVFLGTLTGLTAIGIAKVVGVPLAALIVAAGVLAGVAMVVVYRRYRTVDQWLRYTACLPVLAVLVFLVTSPASALLAPAGETAEGDATGSDVPIVFLMLDELPTLSLLDADGGLDRTRFPNLAAFNEDATWYRNHSVLATSTMQSVPSTLTSTAPSTEPAVWTSHPDSLFSLFAPTHDLHVFETATELCGFTDCSGSGDSGSADLRGLLGKMADIWTVRVSPDPDAPTVDLGEFAETVEAAPSATVEPTASGVGGVLDAALAESVAVPSRVPAFTETFRSTGRPGLHYLHLMLPHQPWTYYPDGTRYDGPSVNIGTTDWDFAVVEQRHLLQAEYADRLVGQILEDLRASGLYDRALVVVTADHGIDLGVSGNARVVTPDTIDAVAYAPLFIKRPGQTKGSVDDGNVMSGDLLPTIADVLGAEITWPTIGSPIDSADVTTRGDEKIVYDFGPDLMPTFQGEVTFGSSSAPQPASRRVGAVPPGSGPIQGLLDRLDVDEQLGHPLDVPDGEEPHLADLISERELVDPPDDAVPGLVSGVFETMEDPNVGVALVEVNGVVVTAAPVMNATFTALLPPGSLRPEGNQFRVARLLDGRIEASPP